MQVALERSSRGGEVVGVVAVELHAQQRAGSPSMKIAQRGVERGVSARVIRG